MTNGFNIDKYVSTAAEFDEACKTGPFGDRAITVHDGVFHADDVCAVALYSVLLGGLNSLTVIRTRKESCFAGVPVDVGERQFDHHGKRYELDSDGIPYSGFSRLWELLKTEFNLCDAGKAWFKQKVVDPVSKQDNGVELEKGEINLFSFVHTFNPAYTEENLNPDVQFLKAAAVAAEIIRRYIRVARAQDSIADRLAYFAKNDQPVVVVEQGIPWVKVLPETPAKFVVYFDGLETYYVQCVPNSMEDPFSKKQALPEAWAGKRDEEFSKLCGVDDGIFCHIARFICGFKSFNSATRIASELASGKFN